MIDELRSLINARIRASLPGERGEIAAALITGERAGISDEVNQAMRNSGLFHILSISGLHMVIMAGTVLWLVRAGVGAHPIHRAPLSHQKMGGGGGHGRGARSICSSPERRCPRSAPGS